MTMPARSASRAPIAIEHWLAALGSTTKELASYALGGVTSTLGAPREADLSGMEGAYISLLGGASALDLALLAPPPACRELAAAMLGGGGPSLTDVEIADAVGELVNMLGGGIKRRMSSHAVDLELGLPKFIHGHVQRTERVTTTCVPVRFGSIEAHILIIHPHT